MQINNKKKAFVYFIKRIYLEIFKFSFNKYLRTYFSLQIVVIYFK